MLLSQSCFTYKELVNSWKGINVNQLIERWGLPTNIFERPDGNTIYYWTIIKPPKIEYISKYSGGLPYEIQDRYPQYCNTKFHVNSLNLITSWQFEGNNCWKKKHYGYSL